MTADTRRIVEDLSAFYDFSGKVVLDVGAGGGQLVDYARGARTVVAVDRDAAALDRLAERARERGLAPLFELLNRDVLQVHRTADVAFFEFCLHLMDEPQVALAHVRRLAPDIVVIDHAPRSPWSWCAAEDDGVIAAWIAVERRGVRRQSDFATSQRFSSYEELEAKLATCGPTSLLRIQSYRFKTDIAIPMPYRIALCS